jgi:hypothetical protein
MHDVLVALDHDTMVCTAKSNNLSATGFGAVSRGRRHEQKPHLYVARVFKGAMVSCQAPKTFILVSAMVYIKLSPFCQLGCVWF